ncbi:hypothetical protein SARC_11712 [Sphaeroforma arctica JP610]|uniref:DNA2/NAM7 helicase-like C-terminal domain-containing protein n=1 Tax=Sphaeroforma arctica JP610 TaxID=667725 RepID=A0A0L0FG68_9EUKA|nr:hypothetical protein SARC_11712 [Sphaeroforma arctica JP610]KNC75769.1 hypothetical protein SARC_11712 [Sphaeroforma arctica JP610]|eukprot:XP_014149671.1 hypothetical protein SARC_11712 [Sphaeroforma arctica JP610]
MVELNRAMLGAKTSYLTAKKALETMNKDFNRLREQERKNILEGAEIIATTLNGSGNQAYVRAGIDIGFTVIDEAAQSTELDVLIALQHNGRKCVMVGDPNQLPATVQSQVSKDLGYDRSMFRRMQLYFMQQPDNIKSPVELLTVQYRMHPEIAAFPSKHFYNGQLRDHHTTFNMPETPVYQHVFGPYMFANVKGMEERSHGSYINQQEAVEALALFIWVCLSCKATGFSGRVGIVTPYSAQKKLIRQKFCSFFSGDSILSHVEIDSVDSYQGREKDIIILSCVRASHSGNIGFLNDVRRLNVALTRAKHCMWVLGNAELLSRDKDSYVFKELADDARERNIMRDDSPWTPYSDSRKHKPPANAMKLDAQIGLALPKATSGYRAMAYESSNMDVDAIPPRLQDRVDRGSVERVREALPPSLQDRVGPSSVDRAGRDSTADERKGSGLGGGGEERTTMVSAVQAKYSQPADRNRHSSAHGVGPSSRGQDSRDRTKTPDIRDTHLSRKRDSHAPDAPDRRARGGSGGRSSRGSSNEIRGHTAKRTRGEEADGNQDRKHARTDTGRRRDEDRSTNTAKHLDKQQNPKAKAKGSGSADGNEMEEGEIDETHTGAGKGKGKEGVARTTSQRDHSHTREDSSARARDRRGSRDSRGSRDDARATTGDGEHAKQLKRSHSQDTKDYANDRVTQLRQEGGRDSRAQPLTQNDGTGFKQSKGQMNNVKHPSNSTKQPMKQSKGQMNNAKHPSNSTKQPMKQSKEQKNNVKQATNNTKQPNSNRLVRESVPNYRQEGDQHPSSRTYVYTNQPGNCKPHSKHPGPQGGPKAAPEGKESFRKGSRVDTVGGSSGERGSSANESANADRQLGEALRENRPKKKPRQAKKSTPPSFLDELLGSMKNDYKNPGGKRQVGRDHI